MVGIKIKKTFLKRTTNILYIQQHEIIYLKQTENTHYNGRLIYSCSQLDTKLRVKLLKEISYRVETHLSAALC